MTERTQRPMTAEQVARFWSKVERTETCWLWTGAQNGNGYGSVRIWNVKHYPHRLAYEMDCGPIPDGLVLDHLCRVRNCVRPDHLEPVTAAENTRRVPPRAACPRGHAYTPENSYFTVRNPTTPTCKTCHRDHERVRKATRRRSA